VLGDEKLQDRLAESEPVTLLGITVHEVEFVPRLTTPEKPSSPVTVTVDVPVVPALTVMLVGLAVTAKPCTVKVTVAEWDREPLAPVTATVIFDDVPNVHDKVALPEPVTLVGETVHAVLFVVRVTTPAKLFSEVIVIVEVAAVPALTVKFVGLAEIVKSREV